MSNLLYDTEICTLNGQDKTQLWLVEMIFLGEKAGYTNLGYY